MTYAPATNWDHYNQRLEGAGWTRTLQARELNAAYHRYDDLVWQKPLFGFFLSWTCGWARVRYRELVHEWAELRSTIQMLGGKL